MESIAEMSVGRIGKQPRQQKRRAAALSKILKTALPHRKRSKLGHSVELLDDRMFPRATIRGA
jgi:hypothetical protein